MSTTTPRTPTTPSPAPNIVLIFMDDMGYGDLSCTGSSLIRTPRMDSVAEQGITFTQMYSAAPTCTPSRAALLTGRYAQRVGLPRVIFPEEPEGLSHEEVTFAEMLGQQGYACGAFGKWHLGARREHSPLRHGFDRFVGLPYSNDMHPVVLHVDDEVEEDVDQSTLTRRYTDEAMDFIDEHREGPFLVYLPHTMPHIPLHVEEGFRGTSAAGTYGDVIECLDHHVGRLLDHLEDRGLAENTLVMITSDNGPWFEGSTGGLRGRKIDTYEGGIRMPFLARWPARIDAGSVCTTPACFIDLMPTLATLTGADCPEDRPLDGVDITDCLLGGEVPERPLFFFSHWHLNAVRRGRWKLHVDRFPTKDLRELPQLFDLEADPGENYNLASLYPQVLDELHRCVEDFGAEISAQQGQAEQRARA
ncbi:sulfatase [Brachybacterium sacelli]|uniref:Sulfatase n=1 Tax=Brachybacterium sacelli TaxID=173364 RepID=A0ABS4WYG9_9MICO|nr:sulfatase [Brachybacterium sacelli]MBP2381246.1 putative sulfatase [Brachybacterium sacelli]